jgi:hypothetical protein
MPLRDVLARLGFEIDDSALKKANINVDGLLSKVTNLKGVVGGALAGVGLGFLKGQIDELSKESSEINKAAIKAGVGFEQFQRIQYQTGLSTEQLTVTFRNLRLGMASAGGTASDANEDFTSLAEGGLDKLGKKKAGEALKDLKVNLKDASGRARESSDVFADTVVKLAAIKDPARQAATAQEIFGRSGADILPLLKKSPEAIRALGEEFDLFGGITDDNRKKLAEYGKEQKRLSLASNALRVSVLSALVPALTFLFLKVNESLTWFKKNVDTSNLLTSSLGVLTAAIIAFGSAAIIAWAKALIGPALIAGAVLFLIAVVDDLIHFFKGDAKTATEELIVLLFGKQGESWIADLRKDVQALVKDLESVEGIGNKIKELFKIFSFGLNGALSQIPGVGAEDAQGNAVGANLAQRGLTRKTRKRTTAALTEEGISAPYFPGVDLAASENKGGIKGQFLPSVTIAAPRPTNMTRNVDAKQNVTINQTINGADSKDAADQSIDGVKVVLAGQRQATLNAVEARK